MPEFKDILDENINVGNDLLGVLDRTGGNVSQTVDNLKNRTNRKTFEKAQKEYQNTVNSDPDIMTWKKDFQNISMASNTAAKTGNADPSIMVQGSQELQSRSQALMKMENIMNTFSQREDLKDNPLWQRAIGEEMKILVKQAQATQQQMVQTADIARQLTSDQQPSGLQKAVNIGRGAAGMISDTFRAAGLALAGKPEYIDKDRNDQRQSTKYISVVEGDELVEYAIDPRTGQRMEIGRGPRWQTGGGLTGSVDEFREALRPAARIAGIPQEAFNKMTYEQLDKLSSEIVQMAGQAGVRERYSETQSYKLTENQEKTIDRFTKQFDDKTKKLDERLSAAQASHELLALADTNPITAEAAKTNIARLSGEVGVLTDRDIARFGGSKAIHKQLAQIQETATTGLLTKENLEYLKEIVDAMEKGINERKKQIGKEISSRASKAVNRRGQPFIDQRETFERFVPGMEFEETSESIPAASRPTQTQITPQTTAPHGNKVVQDGVVYIWNGTEYIEEL